MNQYTEDPLLDIFHPKPKRFGRRANVRDRIIGVAVIAALLIGLWIVISPKPFTTTVTDEHVLGNGNQGGWTVFKGLSEYTVFVRKPKASQTIFLSHDGSNDSMRNLAVQVEAKLLADTSESYDVASVEFSNVIVVCAYRSSCESTKKRVINSAQRLGIVELPVGISFRTESRSGQIIYDEIVTDEFVITE